MKKSEAAELVALVQAAFPRLEITAATVRLYAEMLADVDAELGRAAVLELVKTQVYPTLPTVGEIRQRVTDLAFRRAGLLTAEEAWEVVQWAFRKVGQYRPFPDTTKGGPLLKRAVTAIGWVNLCNSENLVADRAHFFRVYEALVGRERERLTLNPHAAIGGSEAPVLQLASASPKVDALVAETAAQMGVARA